jgi:RAD51-like protein 1
MDKLENYIIEYNVDLIIIDSLASIVRKEYAGSDGSILQERAIFLYKISSNLKIIAEYLNVSVMIINFSFLSIYDHCITITIYSIR